MHYLALVFIATICYCGVQADDVEELINMAEALNAPFTQAALKRLQTGGQWGTKRADRTVDAIIFNPSGKSFTLRENSCTLGNYSNGLLPEIKVPNGRSSLYGIQSNKYMYGVQCTTRYQSDDGKSWFSIKLDNPYFGAGSSVCTRSKDISCVAISGSGKNSQARFVIDVDHNGGGRLMSSQDGGNKTLHEKKTKGGQSTFIKASKRASSVQYI